MSGRRVDRCSQLEIVDDATAEPEVPPDEKAYTAGYKAGYAEGFAAGHAAGLRAAAGANTAATSGWRVLTQPSRDGGGAPPPSGSDRA